MLNFVPKPDLGKNWYRIERAHDHYFIGNAVKQSAFWFVILRTHRGVKQTIRLPLEKFEELPALTIYNLYQEHITVEEVLR